MEIVVFTRFFLFKIPSVWSDFCLLQEENIKKEIRMVNILK